MDVSWAVGLILLLAVAAAGLFGLWPGSPDRKRKKTSAAASDRMRPGPPQGVDVGIEPAGFTDDTAPAVLSVPPELETVDERTRHPGANPPRH